MQHKLSNGKDYQKYFVKVLVLYLLFAFPFSLRSLNSGVYAIGLYILTILTVLVSALSKRPLLLFDATYIIRKERWVFIFFILYILYILILSMVSLMYFNFENIRALLLKLQTIFYVIAVFLVLKRSDFEKLLSIYLKFMVIFSLLGILLTVLIYLNLVQPLAKVNLDSGGVRDLYLFGFVWPDSWSGSLKGLVRLQSYTDEAGTFAFCLLPAIIIAYYRNKYFCLILFIVALILTFSVGAIVFFLLWVVVLMAYIKRKLLKIFIFFGILLVFLVASDIRYDEGFVDSYWDSKISSHEENTSVGARFATINAIFKSEAENPFGLGAGGIEKFSGGIAVGWLIPLVQSGVFGWFFYLLAFLILIYKAVKVCMKNNVRIKPAAQILIVFAFAAFQRSEMDGTLWHWLWIIYFIKQYEPPVFQVLRTNVVKL